MTTALVDFYELLQVPAEASAEEIKTAVRRERRTWVKRQANPDPERRAEAEARVRSIDQAERTLLDAEGRAAYDHERAKRPAPQPEERRESGGDWLARAREFLQEGDAGAAHYAAREAISQRGADHEAWFIRAHASLLLGRPADAEFEFTEAIRIEPTNAKYHAGLGDVCFAQSKWAAARTAFERALRLDPGNPEYRTGIAQVLIGTDQAAAAITIMEEVVAAHPDVPAFRYYLAIAVHDAAIERMTRDPRGGGWVITTAAQAAATDAAAARMESQAPGQPEITRLAGELRRQAARAREPIWLQRGTLRYYGAAFVVFGLFPLLSGQVGAVLLGLLVCAGVIAAYVARHRKPRYELARRELAGGRV
jgi:Tfp pilus assembly protein PilF